MSKEYLEIQKKLFREDFDKFFKANFAKGLNALEEKRKKNLKHIAWLVVLAAILLIICFVLAPSINNEELRTFIFIIVLHVSAAPIVVIIYKYNTEVKNKIFGKLLSFIGDFEYVDTNKYSAEDRRYISSLKLFNRFNVYNQDDRFKGKYNDLPVDIMEINLQKETGSGKRRHIQTIFQGIFIKVACLKKFKSPTIIKSDNIKIVDNKKRVKLEDPEFEKIYDVYSDDQIEARYLITTSLMERLVQLNRKGKNIILSFEQGNVNIALPSKANWFEFPIYKTLLDKKQYKDIIIQFITILSIIDSLKLDQNIGL